MLTQRQIGVAVATMTFLASVVPSSPQFPDAEFDIELTITAECIIVSAGDITFTSTGVIEDPLTATSTIIVQCTNGLAYDIDLDEGLGASATTAVRKMIGPASATINYSLYQEDTHENVWGEDTDGVSASGNGSQQPYIVYAMVPVQATPAAGTYSDTVTVTVTY